MDKRWFGTALGQRFWDIRPRWHALSPSSSQPGPVLGWELYLPPTAARRGAKCATGELQFLGGRGAASREPCIEDGWEIPQIMELVLNLGIPYSETKPKISNVVGWNDTSFSGLPEWGCSDSSFCFCFFFRFLPQKKCSQCRRLNSSSQNQLI